MEGLQVNFLWSRHGHWQLWSMNDKQKWWVSLPAEALRTCLWFTAYCLPASVVLKAYMEMEPPLFFYPYYPGIEPRSLTLQADSLPAEPQGKPKHTGVGSLSLLQWIFLTQELNRGLLHSRRTLYQLSYQGSPFHYPGFLSNYV